MSHLNSDGTRTLPPTFEYKVASPATPLLSRVLPLSMTWTRIPGASVGASSGQVNQRLPLVVGLDAEGLVPEPVRFHLLAEPSLSAEHFVLQLLNHFFAEIAPFGQDVKEPHEAGFAGGRFGQPLARGVGVEQRRIERRCTEGSRAENNQSEQGKTAGRKNGAFQLRFGS